MSTLMLLYIRWVLTAEVVQKTLPLRYYETAHIDQTHHTAFQAMLFARTFAQALSGTPARDPAVGMTEYDDVFTIIFNHGNQSLLD